MAIEKFEDVSDLELRRTCFNHYSPVNWILRRSLILIFIIWTLWYAATIITIMLAGPGYLDVPFFDRMCNLKFLYEAMLQEKAPLNQYPPLWIASVFGWLGGVVVLARTFCRTTERKENGASIRYDLPAIWYITRPVLSMIMAVFMYFVIRSGEVLFTGTLTSPADNTLNTYVIAVIGIASGVFSELAFRKLHWVAKKLMNVPKSSDLVDQI